MDKEALETLAWCQETIRELDTILHEMRRIFEGKATVKLMWDF